jgi:hypothetical protein
MKPKDRTCITITALIPKKHAIKSHELRGVLYKASKRIKTIQCNTQDSAIHCRVTKAEYTHFSKCARSRGLSLSAWVRYCLSEYHDNAI